MTPEVQTRAGERWWEMLSQKPHCQGGTPYKMPTWYHDYTTQIELAKFDKYLPKIGVPDIIYQKKRYTPAEFAPILGLKVPQLRIHILHGATRYRTRFRWDYDFDGYAEKCREYDREQERKADAREEDRERRRLAWLELVKATKSQRAEKSKEVSRKRLEAILAMFETIPRVDQPGKNRWLYLDGVRTRKSEVCKALGVSEAVLMMALTRGDVRFNGMLLEVRYKIKVEKVKLTPRVDYAKRREELTAAREAKKQAKPKQKQKKEPKKRGRPPVEMQPGDRREKMLNQKKKRYASIDPEVKARMFREIKARRDKKTMEQYGITPYDVPPAGRTLYLDGNPVDSAVIYRLTGKARRGSMYLASLGRWQVDDHVITMGPDVPLDPVPLIVPNGSARGGVQDWAIKVGRSKLTRSTDSDKLQKIIDSGEWKILLDRKRGTC